MKDIVEFFPRWVFAIECVTERNKDVFGLHCVRVLVGF